MPGLQIQPHSRRVTGLAVLALSLVAAGSFAAGLTHQLVSAAAPPFPVAQQGPSRPFIAAPEATPAPDMQLAAAAPVRHKPAPAALDVPPPAEAAPAPAAAEGPAAADAAATVAQPPPAPAAPPAQPDPNTSDPPT